MKKLFVLIAMISSPAFAEVPLPGTARKGPIEVTPEGQDTSKFDLENYKVIPRADSRRVQRVLNALRADLAACRKDNDKTSCEKKIQDLESQLRAALAEVSTLKEELSTRPEELHKNRIAVYGGVGPDGVKVEDITNGKKAELNETGPLVAISYGRLLDERWSVTGFVSMATAKTNVVSGFLGAGYDF